MSKASTPKTRLQRTSNPTPPEPESSKKYKIDMSQNNPEMDFNITDLPIPQQFAISNEDIQKIADAVKSKLSEDIVKIINEKTAPLITKIDNLEKENRKLKNEVDALEQYCVSNFLNDFIRDSELLWDRKISDIEVHFWIILAHINFVFFRTFWLNRQTRKREQKAQK
jgi:hypothetical protein